MTSRIRWGDDTSISWTAVFPIWISAKDARVVRFFANRIALADAVLTASVQPPGLRLARIDFHAPFICKMKFPLMRH
jgi:hypothetical protein